MYYLTIQNNYDEVQLALMAGTALIQSDSIAKTKASKELIIRINNLLMSANIKLSDLSFIAANYGPGPFTTLRVVITTVNGLAYAKQIPLIGVNALKAAACEWQDPKYPITAILFNAFGNDVYTLVEHNDTQLFYGVYPIKVLLEKLKTVSDTIRFLGNGTTLHQHLINEYLAEKAYIPEHNPAYCSLSQIAQRGLAKWKSVTQGEHQLVPLYLKRHPADLS